MCDINNFSKSYAVYFIRSYLSVVCMAMQIAATKSSFFAKDIDRDGKLNQDEVMMVVAMVNTTV